MRPCLDCGTPTTRTRCPRCARDYDRNRRPTKQARGYTTDYDRQRATLIGQPCHWCRQPADTADHLTPVSHGGAGGPLVPACHRCNSARGNRPTPPTNLKP